MDLNYWWILLIIALVLSVFITVKYQPVYALAGKYRVKKKTQENKTVITLLPVNGASIPIVTSYTEYTFQLSNGKIYRYTDSDDDYLGVSIHKGDELYVYVSSASGWGDAEILSHRQMTFRDFINNTSLFFNGVKIFFLIAAGMIIIWGIILAISFDV